MSNVNPDPFTTRPEIEGTFGVVTSTHWVATAVGMATLEKGGNAFDAGVAAASFEGFVGSLAARAAGASIGAVRTSSDSSGSAGAEGLLEPDAATSVPAALLHAFDAASHVPGIPFVQ